MLFLSPLSRYGDRRAIRGGVPVCWPWFGDDLSGAGRSAHGFARNRVWKLIKVQQKENDGIVLTLCLSKELQDEALWRCNYNLTMTIDIGEQLTLSLTTENLDSECFVLSQALHTYFAVGDIQQTKISGLHDRQYLDKIESFREKRQQGDVCFAGETDRVYLNSPQKLFIEDPSWSRRIAITSAGSQSTVIWNPWEKASDLTDMHSDAYRYFVCVETANAASDSITLFPGQSHTLSATYRIMPLN